LAEIENNEKMAAMATDDDDQDMSDARAFLLGLHIAQEHPDGNLLIRYLLSNYKSG
jgi:hypothetical protein